MYRFNDCTDEEVAAKAPNCIRTEQQVTQIITYGRAGTPMPAWGIEGGGPKNDQAISDIVAYLKSIQLSPAKAKAQVLENVAELKAQAKSRGQRRRGQPRDARRRRSRSPRRPRDARPLR